MYKCKLKLISRPDVGGGLRTQVVEGYTHQKLELGQSFIMFSKPVDKSADIRYIETSPVVGIDQYVKIKGKIKYLFETQTGSKYVVEITCRKSRRKMLEE